MEGCTNVVTTDRALLAGRFLAVWRLDLGWRFQPDSHQRSVLFSIGGRGGSQHAQIIPIRKSQ